MTNQRLVVSISPHIKNGRTVRRMIVTTIAALMPATLWGFYQFGLDAVALVAVGITAACGTEALISRLAGKTSSLGDGHAVLTGLVLALLVPAGAPFWLVIVGAAMAILVGKMPFGPLGGAPIYPALVGLLIVATSWPNEIKSYVQPTTAPIELKAQGAADAEFPRDAVLIDPSDEAEYKTADLFLGKQVGPIGVISPLLLLLGGLFLILRRVSRWQAPFGFLIGMGLAAGIGHALDPSGCASASFHLFTGSAMFGAFFLCTDWSSTPVTPWGMFLFGLIGGGLAVLLRIAGLPYGAVPWAIVIMSLATPIFDRITPTPFGKVASHA